MSKIIGITLSTKDEESPLEAFACNSKYFKYLSWLGEDFVLVGINKLSGSNIISVLDGLVLTGGVSLHPVFSGSEQVLMTENIDIDRDLFEIKLAQEFIRERKPILGICRGIQVLFVQASLPLIESISQLGKGKVNHYKGDNPRKTLIHTIGAVNKSNPGLIKNIYGKDSIWVNSIHDQGHQYNNKRNYADLGISIDAISKDGIVEIMSYVNLPVIGVQYHPEETNDVELLRYYKNFFTA